MRTDRNWKLYCLHLLVIWEQGHSSIRCKVNTTVVNEQVYVRDCTCGLIADSLVCLSFC